MAFRPLPHPSTLNPVLQIAPSAMFVAPITFPIREQTKASRPLYSQEKEEVGFECKP
jgi:hypothetical protein